MDIQFFDSEKIYQDAERKGLFDMGDNLLLYEDIGFSHKWIQPPVACYFLCTEDGKGNANMAPISMGTAVWGEPPDACWYYTFGVQNSRQTMENINLNQECVLSYFPAGLIKESAISALPIPRGISELEVCKLTELPSKKVKPSGVRECPVNLEAVIINQVQVSNTTIFVAKIVGVSVWKQFIEADKAHPYHPGVFLTDLLFEVSITHEGSTKLNYSKMNLDQVFRPQDDLGDKNHWVGNFSLWLESELERGRITPDEYSQLLQLNQKWLENPDPITNLTVKKALTQLICDMIWRDI